MYGCGGTGKTFLWNAIISRLRSEKLIVLVVASSGIASLLLPGGRTAHFRFKIPIVIDESSMCHIKRGTFLADLIVHRSLIIWDEAPMTHRHCFEPLDRTMRDLLGEADPSCFDRLSTITGFLHVNNAWLSICEPAFLFLPAILASLTRDKLGT